MTIESTFTQDATKVADEIKSDATTALHDLEAKALGVGKEIKTDVIKTYGNATDLDKPLQEVLATVEKDTVKEEMNIKSDVVSTYGVVYRFFHKIKSTIQALYWRAAIKFHTWF